MLFAQAMRYQWIKQNKEKVLLKWFKMKEQKLKVLENNTNSI
jgi:hypothetical protein